MRCSVGNPALDTAIARPACSLTSRIRPRSGAFNASHARSASSWSRSRITDLFISLLMVDFKQKLDKIVEHLKIEVSSLRTGRATPALVEDLEVDYYGAKTPLKAIAAISSPEPRTLEIKPWDKNAIQPIEKAIQGSSLGLNPVTDRDAIRLSIPPLTEERRKELLKLLGKYLEEGRIHVRRERDEKLKEIDGKEKAKEISEDEKFRQKNEAQKIIDEINKKIEETGLSKEKEIATV